METNTGKGMIYVLSISTTLFFLGAMIASDLAPFFIFLLLMSGGWLLQKVFNFKSLILKDDGLQLKNIYGYQLAMVYYADIKKVGFVNTIQGSAQILVVLANDNNELQFDTLQFDGLDEVCRFIEEKIGQY